MPDHLAQTPQDVSIAFFADGQGFRGYSGVGGSESYVRRLASAALAQGARVEYVLFNVGNSTAEVSPGLIVRRCPHLRAALKAIDRGGVSDVVTVLLSPPQELRYALFRRRRSERVRFHRILFGGGMTGVKKLMLSFAHGLKPYNGATFALTERVTASLTGKRDYLLRPPVPDGFYVSPADKAHRGPLQVVFVGRLDPEKGINEVLELFDRLAGRNDIDLTIHGYTWRGLRESEEIHERLQAQHRVRYVTASHERFSAGSEEAMADIFRAADVIVLPYKGFDRTIEPPLILLEAMASLCVPLTRRAGAIPEVVPDKGWIYDGDDFVGWAERQIIHLTEYIADARNELAAWNDRNGVRASRAATAFLQAIRQE